MPPYAQNPHVYLLLPNFIVPWFIQAACEGPVFAFVVPCKVLVFEHVTIFIYYTNGHLGSF